MLTRLFFFSFPLLSPLPSRSSISRNLKSPNDFFFLESRVGEGEVGHKNINHSFLFPSSPSSLRL